MGDTLPAPSPGRPLVLGPIELLLDGADIRYVRVGGCEILRRICVAVRDPGWGTVTGAVSGLRVETRAGALRVDYHCEHRCGEVDFAWDAAVCGHACCGGARIEAELSFVMDGLARAAFLTNRTGICVLHPIAEYAGKPCTIRSCDGRERPGSFPELIAPHQLFGEVRAILAEPAPGLRAELILEGDVFETEDQRNWGDASYKTYCRPLARPIPYALARGERVQQRVRLNISGQLPGARAGRGRITLALGARMGRVPALGLRMSRHDDTMSGAQFGRLRALHPAHLRVELDLGEAGAAAAVLRAALEQSEGIAVPLEVALFLPGPASGLSGLPPELAGCGQRLQHAAVRWLVYRERAPLTPVEDLAEVRAWLERAGPAASLGGGTIGSFAELNRRRPSAAALDVLAYSVNPQVHATDDLSLVENLGALGDAIVTARAFAPGVPLAVGPVTLHRRADPFAAGKSGREEEAAPDPRQLSLLGAAWTAGCLKHLAEAGPESLTLYDTTGPFGLMEADRVYPLYHVLADLGAFAGGAIGRCRSSEPLAVEGLLLRSGRRRRLIIAAFAGDPVAVDIPGLPERARMLRLDATNLAAAMISPRSFRRQTGPVERPLRLWGPCVARIDFEQEPTAREA